MSELGDPDSGEASICCDPEKAPITYHWYQPNGEPDLIDAYRAIVDAEGVLGVDRVFAMSLYRGHMNKLEQGKLLPLHNLKGPMNKETRIHLFELRWKIEHGPDDGENGERAVLRIRAYHNEPRKLQTPVGSTVVGLHVHKKDTDTDDVDDAQDVEIRRAGDRFFEGLAQLWGIQAA